MSAPIRPLVDPDNSKFLQSKKKTRKKKVLRERDEINECDEDDFDEETVKLNNSKNNNNNNSQSINAAEKPRSRSVLGPTATTCDIETLVSLLSSGGSDSEKEDTVPTAVDSSADNRTTNSVHPNIFNFNSALRSRAPMLKKAGKSVSFQETELKQTAGLNRDYYPAGHHRKPPSLQPIANRIRRSQQLANSLNAFQRKDVKKGPSEDAKSDEDKDQPSSDELSSREKRDSSPTPSSTRKPVTLPTPATSTTTTTTATADSDKSPGEGLVDGQTPKERECYRLFQKMSNMGLSVSYDTILRGMLTPTELRVLQKQKSKLAKQQEKAGEGGSSRQNSSETENNDESETAGSGSSGTEGEGAIPAAVGSFLDGGGLEVLKEQAVEQ